nr:ATP-binding cassette domain-containing protein [Gloeothece citriformis]
MTVDSSHKLFNRSTDENLEKSYSRPRNYIGTFLTVLAFTFLGLAILPLGLVISNGLSLSGGQKQRLCVARAVALQAEVILMDEPVSSLDPISTEKIEDLIAQLKKNYSIIIVTHNMQQATRIADYTAFFTAQETEKGNRFGYLVEFDKTEVIFNDPQEEMTQKYVSGSFG